MIYIRAELSEESGCKFLLSNSEMTLYLPTPNRLGILKSEAGNRAESDTNCKWHCG
jgi:hypothetical protein